MIIKTIVTIEPVCFNITTTIVMMTMTRLSDAQNAFTALYFIILLHLADQVYHSIQRASWSVDFLTTVDVYLIRIITDREYEPHVIKKLLILKGKEGVTPVILVFILLF